MSRLDLARRAVRAQLPARVLVAGPPGAGPLMVALDLAERLADRVVVVDAADGESLDLADLHEFDVVRWSPPFVTPELIEVLDDVGPDTALVVDPFSAWWAGVGGLKDLGHAGQWAASDGFVSHLVRAVHGCRGHVVATSRTGLRTHVEVVDGREISRFIAEGPTLDKRLVYAWPVVLRVSSGLDVTVESSRIDPIKAGSTVTSEDIATAYRSWAAGGVPVVDAADAGVLIGAMDLDDDADRKRIKRDFAASFGPPSHLPACQLEAAQEFIARHTTKETP